MDDTSVSVKIFIREEVMRRTGEERLQMASQAFDSARAMVIASMPNDLSDLEFKRHLFVRIYGEKYAGLTRLFN